MLATFKLTPVALRTGTSFNVISKFFVAKTRDQFRKGSMLPAGCCGWSLVHTSRVVLNGLHAVCLVTALWLIGLLCAQCVFFTAFKITNKLAIQASSLSAPPLKVRVFAPSPCSPSFRCMAS